MNIYSLMRGKSIIVMFWGVTFKLWFLVDPLTFTLRAKGVIDDVSYISPPVALGFSHRERMY